MNEETESPVTPEAVAGDTEITEADFHTPEDGEQEPQAPVNEPDTFEIDGETYTLEEIKRSKSIWKDATQKWEEASATKRQYEPLAPIAEALEYLNEDEARQVGEIMRGARTRGTSPAPIAHQTLDFEPVSEGEEKFKAWAGQVEGLVRSLVAEVAELRREPIIAKTASAFADVVPGITDAEVRQAMQATGITNPEYAVKAFFFDKVRQSERVSGVAQGRKPKPEMNPNARKQFSAAGKSVQEIQDAYDQGFDIVD